MHQLFDEICEQIAFHCNALSVFESACLKLNDFFQQKFNYTHHILYLNKLIHRIPRKWEQLQQENGAVNRLIYHSVAEIYPIRFKQVEVMNLYEELELVWKPKLGLFYDKAFEQYSNLLSYLRFLEKQTRSLPQTNSDGTKIVYKTLFNSKFIPRSTFSYKIADNLIRRLHKFVIKLSPFYIQDSILDVVNNKRPKYSQNSFSVTQSHISFTPSVQQQQQSDTIHPTDAWKEDKDLQILKQVYEYHRTDAQVLRTKHETLRNLLSKECVPWSATPFESIDSRRFQHHVEHHEQMQRIRTQLHGYAISHKQ